MVVANTWADIYCENRGQGSGVRSQGSEVRSQGSGVRSQGSGVRGQGSGVGRKDFHPKPQTVAVSRSNPPDEQKSDRDMPHIALAYS